MDKQISRRRRGQKHVPQREMERSIDCLGEDLLRNVLSKLPAASFAYASCVSRSWNAVCNRVLSRPKLSSALSLKSSQQEAIDDVLNKVLSEPIRPHFAVVSIGPSFSVHQTRKLVTERLGSNTPIVTVVSHGIMGRDALTDEFKEILWEAVHEESSALRNLSADRNCGIVLTVGFVPSVKVNVIPMLDPILNSKVNVLDKFVMGIREYAVSVSGCTSPLGIIMFGGQTNMIPVVQKMDYAMPLGTAIAGELCHDFLHVGDCGKCDYVAVALVFARDKEKSHAVGEIRFHVALSTGISPLGPTFKAVSVREMAKGHATWLTAKREGFQEKLDGHAMLNLIYDEMGDRNEHPAFYIGVKKRRKCSIGSEKVRCLTHLAFHMVEGEDQEYLFVGGGGIKTGDSFRFYMSDMQAALSSLDIVSDNFKCCKQGYNLKNLPGSSSTIAIDQKEEVFGGIIFSCCCRGEPFFGLSNVDSSPYLKNFPDATVAGAFCGGEISHGDSSLYGYNEDSQEHKFLRCCLHAFSSVYFVMSYTPAVQVA